MQLLMMLSPIIAFRELFCRHFIISSFLHCRYIFLLLLIDAFISLHTYAFPLRCRLLLITRMPITIADIHMFIFIAILLLSPTISFLLHISFHLFHYEDAYYYYFRSAMRQYSSARCCRRLFIYFRFRAIVYDPPRLLLPLSRLRRRVCRNIIVIYALHAQRFSCFDNGRTFTSMSL